MWLSDPDARDQVAYFCSRGSVEMLVVFLLRARRSSSVSIVLISERKHWCSIELEDRCQCILVERQNLSSLLPCDSTSIGLTTLQIFHTTKAGDHEDTRTGIGYGL